MLLKMDKKWPLRDLVKINKSSITLFPAQQNLIIKYESTEIGYWNNHSDVGEY